MSNLLMIAATDAKSAVEEAVAKNPSLDLEGRLRVAFGETRRHWLVTDDDTRFRAGVGGVLLATSDEAERQRINAEVARLNALGAAASGIPVDLAAAFVGVDDAPIGMLGIWGEVTGR